MKKILNEWTKYTKRLLNESPEAEEFVAKSDAPIGQYVDMLKKIAADPEFQALAKAGKTDGDPGDEALSTESGQARAADLYPTQEEIGMRQSLKDQVTNPPWKPVEHALGLNGEPIYMPTKGPKTGILIFEGAGKKWILDGHHRWSQVMMANPEGEVATEVLKANPAVKTPEDALKITQLAIAALSGKAPTIPLSGANLMDASEDDVKNYVLEHANEEALRLLVKAGKIPSNPPVGWKPGQKVEEQLDEQFSAGKSQQERGIDSRRKAAKRDVLTPDFKKLANAAAEYFASNLGPIKARKGVYKRAAVMPQAGEAGLDQAKVNDLIGSGAINYDNPQMSDLKKKEEVNEGKKLTGEKLRKLVSESVRKARRNKIVKEVIKKRTNK